MNFNTKGNLPPMEKEDIEIVTTPKEIIEAVKKHAAGGQVDPPVRCYAATTSNNDFDNNDFDNPLTIEMIKEAQALMEALAPKEAPEGLNMLSGLSGLRIMKNDLIPENTVMVSKRLFDLIFESTDT